MSRKICTLLAVFCFLTGAAFAQENKQEAKLRAIVEKNLQVKVSSVKKTEYLGLYEVFAMGEILYTDDKASVFIFGGSLVDTKDMRNITAERLMKLTAVKFSELPLGQAIKQVRGNGKRVLASFEDPNCGYCKQLARGLSKLDNITIYTFLFPMLSDDSNLKARQIWCAPDRAKAWNDWMLNDKVPTGKGDCEAQATIDRNIDLGQKLNIRGTPALFFANNERSSGMLPIPQLEEKMNQAAK